MTKRPAAPRNLIASLRLLSQIGPSSRRMPVQAALALGVIATSISLGILAGQVLRVAAGF